MTTTATTVTVQVDGIEIPAANASPMSQMGLHHRAAGLLVDQSHLFVLARALRGDGDLVSVDAEIRAELAAEIEALIEEVKGL